MKRALVLFAFLVAVPATAHADSGRDFATEARLFYRMVACAGTDPVDAKFKKVVAAHCKLMAHEIEVFKTKFVEPADAFFAKARPSNLPTTVVYPFGGGDLATAMVTFPDAKEISTLSLEHAGDPTRLSTLTAKQLKKYLGLFREVMHGLLDHTDFESKKLRTIERGPIPGQLAFFLTGAALLGYQPTHLRFFHVADDGTLVYYTAAEVDALAAKKAEKASKKWVDTDWSVVFSNSELELEKVGDTSHTLIHRHFAANLDDEHFDGSGVQKHLEAKGQVAMMTKAASYLLWLPDFSKVSSYIATHLAWMVSDASGLAPADATSAGLEQETYGKFTGAMRSTSGPVNKAVIKLFKQQKQRKIAFRYGYTDVKENRHLVITRPKATQP